MIKQDVASKNVLAISQQEKFPYTLQKFGLEIIVQEGVFSPKHFNGYEIFTRNFPAVQGEQVLEVGCGTGVTGLYIAKNGADRVVLVDINPNAVQNTRENAQRNGITNYDARESDVFSAIKEDERFDTIYWNMPFMPASDDYQFESMLERALFDPRYKLTERFLQEAPTYLKDKGRMLIGWGDSKNHEFGNPERLCQLAERYGFSIKLLVEEQSTEQNPVKFQLYELRRLQNEE
tara:strand:- start:1620 stop:2321 length:702 start_codon:yes stop_codon:yes gene_type:complete